MRLKIFFCIFGLVVFILGAWAGSYYISKGDYSAAYFIALVSLLNLMLFQHSMNGMDQ